MRKSAMPSQQRKRLEGAPAPAREQLGHLGFQPRRRREVHFVQIVDEEHVDAVDAEPLQAVLVAPHHAVVRIVVAQRELAPARPRVGRERCGGARGTHAPNDITRRSSEEQLARWRAAAERDRTAVRDRRPELGNWTAPSPSPPPASCEQPVGFRRQEVASTGTPTEPGASASTEFPTGKLLLLAETHTRYLVCEDPSGLRVVDVHRATCVLVRDALRRGIERGGVRAQRLLFPVMVEATESACDALETNTITAVLGFDARRAGPTSVAIHSMPHPLAGRAPEPLIRIVIDAVTRDRKDWIALSDALSATVLSSAEQNASAAFTTEAPAAVIARLERLGEAAVQEATVATIPWSELERRSRR